MRGIIEFVRGNGKRKAVISDNGGCYHVTFWINEEQVSARRSGATYKTLAGARRAAQKWVA